MRFLDRAKIYIKAGDGGRGCISFRREKFVEFGGPNGGNGGDGGNVYLEVDGSLNTLIDFRYKQHFRAPSGVSGKGSNLFGSKGEDLILKVPCHTIVWNEDKTHKITELNKDNPKFLIATAGKGGKGNASFKSSTNRAPKFAELGTTGEEIWVWLELNLFADVGLVGYPNAGKSTLLSLLTNAKPKIASYAFSTTIPSLGVAEYKNSYFIVADIPGLIHNAHEGKGLGCQFLSHINKCRILLHAIDASTQDLYASYSDINRELELYNNGILTKKLQIIVITKTDLVEHEVLQKRLSKFKKSLKDTHPNILLTSQSDPESIEKLLITTSQQLNILNTSTSSSSKSWSPI